MLRDRDERVLVLAAGLAAALPIAVSTVRAVVVGWLPYGDDAYIAVHAYDVLTSDPPLVGQWSSGATAVVEGEVVYSPGPLLFWLLALPARFLGPSSLAVTMGLVNVLCVLGAVALAHRRGGRALMLATAVAIPLMLGSLPGDSYSDVWNSSAGLMPLLLLVFLAWSVAVGEYRLLPLTVVVASFVSQVHLTFAAPGLAVTAVALVALVVVREVPWRWTLAAAVLALVCWSAPLFDQLTNSPGNLDLLVQAATSDAPTAGADAGWRALVHAVGVPPWWLRDPRDPLERIGDLTGALGFVAVASALVLLGVLALALVVGARRRRRDMVAAAALALALCAAVAADAASTPEEALATAEYTLRWASPAGMCVWLLTGWCVAAMAQPALAPGRRLSVLGVAAAAAIATVVALSADRWSEPFDPIRSATERVEDALPPDSAVRVDASGNFFLATNFQAAIAYSLRREGRTVVVPGLAKGLGRKYATGAHDQLVRIDVDAPPPPRARPIARVAVRDTFESEETPKHVVNLSLPPD